MGVTAVALRQQRTPIDFSILEAAKDVFAREGFARATVETVAELAGVGKGTVYRHFGNKAALGQALLSYCLEQNSSILRTAIVPGSSVRSNLRRIITTYLISFQENQCLHKVLLFEGLNTVVNSGLTVPFRQQQRQQVEIIAQLLDDGIECGELSRCNSEEIATLLLGAIHTVIRTAILLEQPMAIEKNVDNIMLCYLRGLQL